MTQEENVFVPVGNFEDRQGPAGQLRLHPADQFLVCLLRHGDVKGRLTEFDQENVAETDKDARHILQVHVRHIHNLADLEAAGRQIEPDCYKEQHRFIGHRLYQFAFRSFLTVGRSRRVPRDNQADAGHGERERPPGGCPRR
jgi:hypothetical protein